ncbi:MAG: 50S ribosomal protein L10 [Halobacteriota archaeon]
MSVLTREVPEWKRREIEEFQRLLQEHEAVGVVNVEGIASRQFQKLRGNLHGAAAVRVGRNTLMRRALEAEGYDDLVEHVSGQSGLLFTDENPFSLYRKIEEGKSPAPLKPGQVAPNDVVIPEGDTGFDPGPFVGDLQQIGAAARIDEGAIKVVEDSVVVEEGEVADAETAEVLAKLEIEPIEVGLDLRVLYEDGVLFEPEDLDVDVDEYRDDLAAAASGAFNLAMEAAVVNDDTAGALLSKARGDALAVGVEASVYEPGVLEGLVSEADAQLRALASSLDDDALPEELRGVEAPAEPAPEAGAGETEEDAEDDADEDEAEEDEGDAEDDAAEGLGNLF